MALSDIVGHGALTMIGTGPTTTAASACPGGLTLTCAEYWVPAETLSKPTESWLVGPMTSVDPPPLIW